MRRFEIGGRRLRRNVHAEVDGRRRAEAENTAIVYSPSDEGAASSVCLDQTAPPRLVEGSRHRRQVDAENFCNGPLRRQPVARLNAPGPQIGFDSFDDAAILELAALN